VSLQLALFLGLLQGFTELFPVSSLGHAVVVPGILRLDVHVDDKTYVAFLALLHLGTAAALLLIYREDWVRLIGGFVRAGLRGEIKTPDERLALQIALATVPVGVVGVIFQTRFEKLFASPVTASCFLLVNGAILLGAERLRRMDERRKLARADVATTGQEGTALREQEEAMYSGIDGLTFRTAILVGCAQIFALFPGISRSGITLAAGLLGGLRHEEALRFTFLLATPVILGAGLVSIPDLASTDAPIGNFIAGAVLAGLAAYASARFLIRYFHVGRLEPYAIYCGVLGVVGIVFAH
jgi:undecaprenyl-diphosphatase